MNSGNPKSMRHGNPERSPQKGNVQRLPDYRLERPAPTGRNVQGDEIVQPPRKLGDNCNQLVVGSNPIVPAIYMLPSSSGLGYVVLSHKTGVRLPVGAPSMPVKSSARVAQQVEHTLGKGEVHRFEPDLGLHTRFFDSPEIHPYMEGVLRCVSCWCPLPHWV